MHKIKQPSAQINKNDPCNDSKKGSFKFVLPYFGCMIAFAVLYAVLIRIFMLF